MMLTAYHDRAAACFKCLSNSGSSQNDTACWKIRTLDIIVHQLHNGNLRIIHNGKGCVYCFCKIMRRYIGRHTYRNTDRTVYQQIRESGRQHSRLSFLIVIVGYEINGILIDILHHFHSDFRHTGFGITHCRRTVTIHGTEVTMSLYQHVAVAEVLCHTNHGIIYGCITVRMILTDYFTNDTR